MELNTVLYLKHGNQKIAVVVPEAFPVVTLSSEEHGVTATFKLRFISLDSLIYFEV